MLSHRSYTTNIDTTHIDTTKRAAIPPSFCLVAVYLIECLSVYKMLMLLI